MRAVYTGHEALTFSDYIDLDTGRTLTAEPGGVYDIAPASGRPVGDIPAGWFTPVSPDGELTKLAVAETKKGVASIDEIREHLDLPPSLKPAGDGEE